MVNQHSPPWRRFPCVEDAIAYISAFLGKIMGRWSFVDYGVTSKFLKTPPKFGLLDHSQISTWLFPVTKVVAGVPFSGVSLRKQPSTLRSQGFSDSPRKLSPQTRFLYLRDRVQSPPDLEGVAS